MATLLSLLKQPLYSQCHCSLQWEIPVFLTCNLLRIQFKACNRTSRLKLTYTIFMSKYSLHATTPVTMWVHNLPQGYGFLLSLLHAYKEFHTTLKQKKKPSSPSLDAKILTRMVWELIFSLSFLNSGNYSELAVRNLHQITALLSSWFHCFLGSHTVWWWYCFKGGRWPRPRTLSCILYYG